MKKQIKNIKKGEYFKYNLANNFYIREKLPESDRYDFIYKSRYMIIVK